MQRLKEVRFTVINMDYFPKDIDKLKKKKHKNASNVGFMESLT